MRKKKKQLPFFLYIVLLAGAVFLLVRHFHIKHFNVIEPDVLYTSGQPRGMDYTRLLYKYNIGSIVNVRSASEHRERHWHNEEVTWVRNNGVNYFELPIEKSDDLPDEQTRQEFLAIMADKTNLPVLLHDSDGRKRVSILAAVWALKANKYSVDEAIGLVERIKEQPLLDAERNFINSLAQQQ
ncbi:MAG: hypothetical protein OEW48_16550 [Phycisphaerae bacterium]|nr:hypothetical protein [Phycisphaerae bacterium]